MVDMMDKVRLARKMYPSLDIKVDGGVNIDTARLAKEAGANVLVAGIAIFGSSDREGVIKGLLNA